jgi:Leucine-rich repeat (LRR) protein
MEASMVALINSARSVKMTLFPELVKSSFWHSVKNIRSLVISGEAIQKPSTVQNSWESNHRMKGPTTWNELVESSMPRSNQMPNFHHGHPSLDWLVDSAIGIKSTRIEEISVSVPIDEVTMANLLCRVPSVRLIHAERNCLKSIEGFTNLAQLTYLNISFNPISDISTLSTSARLRHLLMYGTNVKDIGVLQNLPIRVLDLGKTPVEKFQDLRNIKELVKLNLESTSFQDISILKDLKHLRVLNLRLCQVQMTDVLALIKTQQIFVYN